MYVMLWCGPHCPCGSHYTKDNVVLYVVDFTYYVVYLVEVVERCVVNV